ncbi:TadE family type IV pilus minor pilin [Streptomyces gobiensis]|uniref:TadE family type IV pilus minor pilin n=1 Tax=Streptomyces gobiensis TaxID=2875706 RepID=UPI001E4B87E9|nr:TadE family type IV pilus minor pilin [Streptomyces gobiensis]UGY92323.1 pilus assembly protein [Streptomyces gobiensis]
MPLSDWHGPDRGQVTAETAVVVPSLVLLTAMLAWGVLVAAAQIQCVDAARAGARAAARAEPFAKSMAVARSVAPRGAEVELAREGELVRVRVSARSAGPGPLTIGVRAEAVAHAEES